MCSRPSCQEGRELGTALSHVCPLQDSSRREFPNMRRGFRRWHPARGHVFSQLARCQRTAFPGKQVKIPPLRLKGDIFQVSGSPKARNGAIGPQAPATSLSCSSTWHDRQNSEGEKNTLKISPQMEPFHVAMICSSEGKIRYGSV